MLLTLEILILGLYDSAFLAIEEIKFQNAMDNLNAFLVIWDKKFQYFIQPWWTIRCIFSIVQQNVPQILRRDLAS